MSFLRQKIKGLEKRVQCWSLGIIYLSSRSFRIPSKLRINGRSRELKFNDPDSGAFRYEFTEICLNDCYQLALLKKHLGKVEKIVDIGANQGIFLVAARNRFPHADITAYEPNPRIEDIIAVNSKALDVNFFREAVTKEDTRMELRFYDSDLHTTASISHDGNVKGTSFSKVVDRTGGEIDILKIDCEGGEWDILEDKNSWNGVRGVTMEYHLWAKDGSSVKDIKTALETIGFIILSLDELTDSYGLITAVKK